ncbi:hypothetical protein KDI_35200 [Dictyobacter arantiisoli]|uniref:Uncharacterized protein n=1 Tax=Dictyobacter arantiisoli TaxID=2014874 RepID=A0A5A5TFN4_9CHLR|nr:hypothetical protein KDI_35200 [Dictyobacter arantiisoli]
MNVNSGKEIIYPHTGGPVQLQVGAIPFFIKAKLWPGPGPGIISAARHHTSRLKYSDSVPEIAALSQNQINPNYNRL